MKVTLLIENIWVIALYLYQSRWEKSMGVKYMYTICKSVLWNRNSDELLTKFIQLSKYGINLI